MLDPKKLIEVNHDMRTSAIDRLTTLARFCAPNPRFSALYRVFAEHRSARIDQRRRPAQGSRSVCGEVCRRTILLQLRSVAVALETGAGRGGWGTGAHCSPTRGGHLDLLLGHSYEDDRRKDRANCRLHSLPMDGPGSHHHLTHWWLI